MDYDEGVGNQTRDIFSRRKRSRKYCSLSLGNLSLYIKCIIALEKNPRSMIIIKLYFKLSTYIGYVGIAPEGTIAVK